MLTHLIGTGAACIELDPLTDPAACKRATQGRTSVLGMLHPVHVLRETGACDDVLRSHSRKCWRHLAPGGGFIVGPGCALPPDTPAANIHAVDRMCPHRWAVTRPTAVCRTCARSAS